METLVFALSVQRGKELRTMSRRLLPSTFDSRCSLRMHVSVLNSSDGDLTATMLMIVMRAVTREGTMACVLDAAFDGQLESRLHVADGQY